LNFTTAKTTNTFITAGTGINALGYNIFNNYLYASNFALAVSSLVQIGGTGLLTPVAQLPLSSSGQNWNNGDVDEKGQYWASYNGGNWIKVDVVPGSATYGQVVASGTADPLGYTIPDWAYVPGGGDYLWALGAAAPHDQAQLMRFNRTAHTWVLSINFGKITGSNAWGAIFAGANQTIVASETVSGEIWQFPLPALGVIPIRLSVGPPNSSYDGARCINAI
jgi:hypothetical protein